MNRFKKFTSLFDKEKLNIYKRFLKRGKGETPSADQIKQAKTKEEEEKKDIPPAEINISPTTGTPTGKKKHYIRQGPHLYISQILNRGGPMTTNEIWNIYKKDEEAQEKEIFPSKEFLRRTVIPAMMQQGKIVKAGYSQAQGKYLGYNLVPEKAFKRTDPEVLVRIEPRPNIRRFNRSEIIELLKKIENEKNEQEKEIKE